MIVAKAGFDILGKFFPTAVKALGRAGLAEASLAAGGVAAVTTEVCDRVVIPVAQKGYKILKAKYDAATEGKKQELLEKRATLLEEKAKKMKEAAANEEVQPEEVKAEVVEEKPKKGSKKNK